jgi:hypothetical protein
VADVPAVPAAVLTDPYFGARPGFTFVIVGLQRLIQPA